MVDNKWLPPKLLQKYFIECLKQEYGFKFDERDMMKIMDGLDIAVERLIKDGYSFRIFGFKFETFVKPPKIYRDVRDGKVKVSLAHYGFDIEIPKKFKKDLQLSTRFVSGITPEPIGIPITQEEFDELKANGYIPDENTKADYDYITLSRSMSKQKKINRKK